MMLLKLLVTLRDVMALNREETKRVTVYKTQETDNSTAL
jgi:hypothetical protein